MKRKIKYILNKIYDKFIKFRLHKTEIKKVNDKRRQRIIDTYKLTKLQEKEIDDYFLENLGKKIPYDWHRLYSSYTGVFQKKYIPELIYIPDICRRFVKKEYCSVLTDKDLLPLIVNGIENCRTAKIYISCVNGNYRDENMLFISKEKVKNICYNIGKVFIKPTRDTGSGIGCRIINIKNGVDIISNDRIEDIIKIYENNFNIQEVINNCDSISKLHPYSLNTFRIITYCWNNKVFHVPIAMRIGRNKNFVDNAHAGGIFIYIDDDGNLAKEAYTEFQNRFIEHPDTKIKFEGYKIPEIKIVIEAVEKLQQRIPQAGMISWDATVNDKGEVIIIELNLKAQSIWFPQMASGKPAFGNNTKEILNWLRDENKNKES